MRDGDWLSEMPADRVMERILGQRIRAARERAGLTTAELCRKADVKGAAALMALEDNRDGKACLSLYRLRRLGRALGVDYRMLLPSQAEIDAERGVAGQLSGAIVSQVTGFPPAEWR